MSILKRLFNRKEQLEEMNDSDHRSGNSGTNPDELNEDEDKVTDAQEMAVKDKADSGEEEIYEILEREILPAKIICPDCGGITLEGLEFCDKCGGELL